MQVCWILILLELQVVRVDLVIHFVSSFWIKVPCCQKFFDGKASRDLYLSAIHKFGILRDAKGSENFEIPLKDREGRPLAVVKKFDSGGRMIFTFSYEHFMDGLTSQKFIPTSFNGTCSGWS